MLRKALRRFKEWVVKREVLVQGNQYRFFGTTWKSKVSVSWYSKISAWQLQGHKRYYNIDMGKLTVRVRKPKWMVDHGL